MHDSLVWKRLGLVVLGLCGVATGLIVISNMIH